MARRLGPPWFADGTATVINNTISDNDWYGVRVVGGTHSLQNNIVSLQGIYDAHEYKLMMEVGEQ